MFKTSDFYYYDGENGQNRSYFGPKSGTNVTNTCRYRAFRTDPNPDRNSTTSPDLENEYSTKDEWLYVFTARLCFIVCFEVISIISAEWKGSWFEF